MGLHGRGECAPDAPESIGPLPEPRAAMAEATDCPGRGRPMLGRARRIEAGPTDDRDYVDHHCPACDHALKVRAAYAGRAVLCKFCGRRFVALAPPWPAILPISGERPSPSDGWGQGDTPSDPRSDVIAYLAYRVAEAGERNHRLEAERQQLRRQIDDLSAKLLRRAVRLPDRDVRQSRP